MRTSQLRRALDPAAFIASLAGHGVDAFFGVPDSLLKSFNAALLDAVPPERHIVAANEGAAVAMAAGYHMATGRVGGVYMQNSGFGNALNPLLSLAHPQVYGIPMLLLVGWRGDPSASPDEPQHVAQGAQMEALLEASQVPFWILDQQTTVEQLEKTITLAVLGMREKRAPHALLFRREAFEAYSSERTTFSDSSTLTRAQAIEAVLSALDPTDVVVGTTGMISREIDDARRRRQKETGSKAPHADFLCVGSMGHAISIGVGLAMGAPNSRVVVIDGDGASLMHLGSLPVAASRRMKNLHHIVLNNGAHDSVGGQPTVGLNHPLATDGWLSRAAADFGYLVPTPRVDRESDVEQAVRKLRESPTSAFLEIIVSKGHRPGLGRPVGSPQDKRAELMALLSQRK